MLIGLAGTPRSGSTVLAGLFAQNPRMHVSSTSALPQTLHQLTSFYSRTDTAKSEFHVDGEAAYHRLRAATIGFARGYYSGEFAQGKTIIDKSRAWPFLADCFWDAFPDGYLVVTTRDPRDVFASMERENRKQPLFNFAESPFGRTIESRLADQFDPRGVIGMGIAGSVELLQRRSERVAFVRYEALVENPEVVLGNLYDTIGLPKCPFHDYDDVDPYATDLDAMYLGKFPHNASGKVEARDWKWSDYLPGDVGAAIIQRTSYYCRAFGYG